MLRLSLALSSLSLLLVATVANGQSLAHVNQSVSETGSRDVIARAIAELKRLDEKVIVYRSLAEFEDSRKLARVSLRTFEHEIQEVDAELQPLLNEMPAGKLKLQLTNALDSFRDGAFWWRKIDQPRVINVSVLAASAQTRSPADAAFVSSVPYTVAIHWRQARAYLNQSEKLVNESMPSDARQTLR
ncbi:MAG TPA: hypothetical protein VHP99_09985 [Pyrinomonadaceae bacterium]|nr:hypothetical protein [Pyrinomonadaceae bacterium]